MIVTYNDYTEQVKRVTATQVLERGVYDAANDTVTGVIYNKALHCTDGIKQVPMGVVLTNLMKGHWQISDIENSKAAFPRKIKSKPYSVYRELNEVLKATKQASCIVTIDTIDTANDLVILKYKGKRLAGHVTVENLLTRLTEGELCITNISKLQNWAGFRTGLREYIINIAPRGYGIINLYKIRVPNTVSRDEIYEELEKAGELLNHYQKQCTEREREWCDEIMQVEGTGHEGMAEFVKRDKRWVIEPMNINVAFTYEY